jgi:hypothetical protein
MQSGTPSARIAESRATSDHPPPSPATPCPHTVGDVRNVYVPLPEDAVDRLRQLADREYRDTKAQAAWLILDGLRRAGLDPDPSLPAARAAANVGR